MIYLLNASASIRSPKRLYTMVGPFDCAISQDRRYDTINAVYTGLIAFNHHHTKTTPCVIIPYQSLFLQVDFQYAEGSWPKATPIFHNAPQTTTQKNKIGRDPFVTHTSHLFHSFLFQNPKYPLKWRKLPSIYFCLFW